MKLVLFRQLWDADVGPAYQGVSQSKIEEGGGGGNKRKSSIYHSLVDLNF